MGSILSPTLGTRTIPLSCMAKLISDLRATGVAFIHWKSNHRLEADLRTGGELDLLVAPASAVAFEEVLARHGFHAAECQPHASFPGIRHYFGLDAGSGRILHLHVYFQLVTGGGLLKNFRFPSEALFGREERDICGVPLPAARDELALFIVRKGIESSSILEMLFLRRERANVLEELRFLEQLCSAKDAALRAEQLLEVSVATIWLKCYHDIVCGVPLFRSWWHGWCMSQRLRSYRLHTPLSAAALRLRALLHTLKLKFVASIPATKPKRGGKIIAFVGGEASGKSTSVEVVSEWLRPFYPTATLHAGKPPPTVIGFIPRLLLPIMRKLFHRFRTNVVELKAADLGEAPSEQENFLYMLRSVMIAYEQYRHIVYGGNLRRKGYVVICDRFPSSAPGGMDGPRLDPECFRNAFLRRALARLERAIYERIPKPDCIFRLRVPLDLALLRNAARTKPDGEESAEYVAKRHSLMNRWHVSGTNIIDIENEGEWEQVLSRIKSAAWQVIHSEDRKQD